MQAEVAYPTDYASLFPPAYAWRSALLPHNQRMHLAAPVHDPFGLIPGLAGDPQRFGKKGIVKMFDSRADLFFESPNIIRDPPGDYGVLHLLRRDIFLCLGWNPVTQVQTSYSTLWPGGMAILAGIDLVAKFFKGDDTIGQVGQRFCDYITKYFLPISSVDAEVIYQLRNALLHSFGLYSQTKTNTYRFVLSADNSALVQSHDENFYQIDLRTLHLKFEDSLGKYMNDLDMDSTLQVNFLKMFDNYGAVYFG